MVLFIRVYLYFIITFYIYKGCRPGTLTLSFPHHKRKLTGSIPEGRHPKFIDLFPKIAIEMLTVLTLLNKYDCTVE